MILRNAEVFTAPVVDETGVVAGCRGGRKGNKIDMIKGVILKFIAMTDANHSNLGSDSTTQSLFTPEC